MLFKSVATLCALAAAVCAAVIEASDKDIDFHVNSGVPTILSIFAPWCGHCKTFHPVFDELASMYEHAKDKIRFVKIDGDANRKASTKFEVQYFPTIKWVEGDKHEPVEQRDLKSLQDLIEKKVGVKSKVPGQLKEGESKVVTIADNTIDEQLKDKAGLVAFTAEWCGHCKKLKPIWEELAQLHSRDDDVVIGTVDCTDGRGALGDKYDISGFPTVLFFDKDGSEPRTYAGGRALQDFTKFLQEEGASFRNADGSLSDDAGIIDGLAEDAATIVDASEEEVSKFVEKVKKSGSPYVEKYLRAVQKIVEGGSEYIAKETGRLTKLLSHGDTAPEKLDNIKVRLNILKSFVKEKLSTAKEEL